MFSAGTFQLKCISFTQSFTGRGISGKCFL